MTSDVKSRPRKAAETQVAPADVPGVSGLLRVFDGFLALLFLGLTFLLGVFPLKDTDFWWHLRTGDLIRRTWRLPVTDWYTFGAEGRPWVDLHWGFEVLVSWGYEHGGVVALNLGKCAITTLAVLLLISARRREWPVWPMLLAWLPALFVLSGRMYIRPETLTLLYLAAFLAILFRIETHPRLAYLLPAVEVLWVNSQGLFILGPVIFACALVDAALRPGAFGKEKQRWWRTVGLAAVFTGLACVANPYGLLGATFPFQLALTMNNPIFERTIAELMPLPKFIEDMGFRNLPLQLHLVTMVLGALSFVVPLTWRAYVRIADGKPAGSEPPASGRKAKKAKAAPKPPPATWRLSPFRLLLFLAFSMLSWKATRNSHQFAAVVGTVTAWNFAEWAWAVKARREARQAPRRFVAAPRLATLGGLMTALVLVASGRFYALAGEGRTIGLGEQPYWFPHAAARFAGGDGMPGRFVCFHNGHASLYEYYNGPDRKVYADARLEVMGPEVYAEYIALERQISGGAPGWPAALEALGNPGVLVDNVYAENSSTSAALLGQPGWTLTWYDPIAAVFVPNTAPAAKRPYRFAAAHFHPDPAADPRTSEALLAWVKPLSSLALQLHNRRHDDAARPVTLLGEAYARRLRDLDPKALDGWKYLGLLEVFHDQIGSPEKPIPRYRMPFDPVFDLPSTRATYALREAYDRAPDDAKVLLSLAMLYQSHEMTEAALPLLQHLAILDPPNQKRQATRMTQDYASAEAERLARAMGPEPSTTWKNMDELDRAVSALLKSGRAAAAADLLESAYPVQARPWDVTDRLATLRLHLGRPDLARRIWEAAHAPPRPALVAARIAAAELVADDFESARKHYTEAIAREPELFEAHYGLAILERDAGRSEAALAAARSALAKAPTEVSRAAAKAIVELVEPFAARRSGPSAS